MSFTRILGDITIILLIANIILAFALVFMERRNPAVTWAWLLVLVFIPVVGLILYLFLGQDLRKKKVFSIKEAEDDIKRAAHQQKYGPRNPNTDLIFSVAEHYRDIVQLHLNNAQAVFTQNNKVRLLNNGTEKYPALIQSIKEAKDHIHMEYYIIRNDEIGKTVRDLLAAKAREGTKVRLLYDGMGCILLPKSYFTPIIEAGGEVAAFYPPFIPYINIRVNYRNHRKITVIDGKKAFIGGLNLGDEYLGKSPKYGFWRDLHFLIEGDAVDQLQLRFLMDWQYASNLKVPSSSRYFPPKPSIGSQGMQIVASGPDSGWAAIRQGYFSMISKAQKRVYIQTPYFVPDDSLAEALKVSALRGIDVRIMIPCKPDHPFVYWASLSYIGELLEAGAKAYRYMNGFLHSKLLVVDGEIGSAGTANLDIRSFKVNFEINAFFYDKDTVSLLEKTFLQDLEKCEEITPASYASRSAWIKTKESISRLLSPLL